MLNNWTCSLKTCSRWWWHCPGSRPIGGVHDIPFLWWGHSHLWSHDLSTGDLDKKYRRSSIKNSTFIFIYKKNGSNIENIWIFIFICCSIIQIFICVIIKKDNNITFCIEKIIGLLVYYYKLKYIYVSLVEN